VQEGRGVRHFATCHALPATVDLLSTGTPPSWGILAAFLNAGRGAVLHFALRCTPPRFTRFAMYSSSRELDRKGEESATLLPAITDLLITGTSTPHHDGFWPSWMQEGEESAMLLLVMHSPVLEDLLRTPSQGELNRKGEESATLLPVIHSSVLQHS
jgi:hypothetical protein